MNIQAERRALADARDALAGAERWQGYQRARHDAALDEDFRTPHGRAEPGPAWLPAVAWGLLALATLSFWAGIVWLILMGGV